ncbi:TetR/AcrR family transcriptional regulator [Edwardsiella tarda]|uniref:TetR/AcrR family transcriptional regulator n=1 Tax=Edwardsiella tarda TaxID=636 RepID=UPI00351BF16D
MTRPSTEQRKNMIIETVLALFKEKGMAAVSTRDVAEKAGLARSHVYHYFKDWKALSICAVEHFFHHEIAELERCLAPLTPSEALSVFIRDNLPARQDASWRIYLDAWNASLCDPQFAASYSQIITAWHRALENILLRGVQSGEFNIADTSRSARQIIALINGYADELILDPTPDRVALAQQEIMDVVLRLIH